MNYEKLSRAMRYYYGNGELNQVDKRTTYQVCSNYQTFNLQDSNNKCFFFQFGSKSDYWRTSKD